MNASVAHNKNPRYLPPFLHLLTFSLLLKFVAPSLFAGDGGELISSSYLLGNAHSPGYPLYLLGAKLFTFLPLGNIALRVNLLSTFLAGICASIFYLLAATLMSSATALFATLLFIGGTSFSYYSLISEVYHVEIVLFLLFILSWRQRRSLALLGLVAGLGMVAHYGLLLMLVAFVPYLLFERKPVVKRYISGLTMVLLGLALFSYLPLRAVHQPALNWGNPDNWAALLSKLTRSRYHEISQPRTVTGYLQQLYWAVLFLKQELFYPLYLLLIPGTILLYKRASRILVTLLSGAITYFTLASYFLNYQIRSLAFSLGPKFYIMVSIIIALLLGAGFEWLLLRSKRYVNHVLCFGLFLSLLLANLTMLAGSRRDNSLYYDYGLDLLRSLPAGARLMCRGDNPLFATLYLSQVEKRREDILLTATEGNIFNDEYGYAEWSAQALQGIERRILASARKPVFYTNYRPDLPLQAQPLLYRYQPAAAKSTLDHSLLKHLKPLPSQPAEELMLKVVQAERVLNYSYYAQTNGINVTRQLEWLAQMGENIPVIIEQLGQFYFEHKQFDRALAAYQRVTTLDSRSYQAFNQIGLTYKYQQKPDLAKAAFIEAIKLNGNYTPALYNQAALLYETNELESALKASERVYQTAPDYPSNLYLRGLILRQLNKPSQARSSFQRFLQLTPKSSPWYAKAVAQLNDQ